MYNLHKSILSLFFTFFTIIAFSQSTSIRGLVKDDDGKPIKDASIYLYSDKYCIDSTDTKLFEKYWTINGASSTEDGEFLITPNPSGKFYIVAVKYGYYIPELKEITLTKNKTLYLNFKMKIVTDSLELRRIHYNIYKL